MNKSSDWRRERWEGCAGLFRRARYLRDSEMAAGQLQSRVITFTADIGPEEVEPAAPSPQLGIKKSNIFIEDLREEFVRDYVFRCSRQPLYEGDICSALRRAAVDCQALIEIARKTGAEAIAHGATARAMSGCVSSWGPMRWPSIKVIAPWREWDLTSRQKLLAYADKHGIPVDFKKRKGGALLDGCESAAHHYEGGILEDPNYEPRNRCGGDVSPERAPNRPKCSS